VNGIITAALIFSGKNFITIDLFCPFLSIRYLKMQHHSKIKISSKTDHSSAQKKYNLVIAGSVFYWFNFCEKRRAIACPARFKPYCLERDYRLPEKYLFTVEVLWNSRN